jgi:nucleoside-diphosphate-sugar epimerase
MAQQIRVLLTGASGSIGREVLAQLIEQKQGYEIIVFDKPSKAARAVLTPYERDVEVVYGDISFFDQIAAVTHNIDVVIHLAAIIPPLADDNPKLAERVNVQGTKNLLKAISKNSPNAFLLYSSSVAVYGDRLQNPDIRVGDTLSPSLGDAYAQTKITTENLIQESGLAWSIFRLAAIIGVKNHKMSKIMFHMPLDTMMEICSPSDTARAFVNAIEKQGELQNRIFNLGGGPQFRITYRNFLQTNFKLYGLGDFDFPEEAFAQKNFHCGNYVDGDVLENILHFRRDNLETYVQNLKKAISPIQLLATKMFAGIAKKKILKLSEPLEAKRNNDIEMLNQFF